jgi:AraC-like DNA-binding protein/quercetin dioxygenase-like cupin family protein
MAYFYSAAERRSRGALWPSFAPALTVSLPYQRRLSRATFWLPRASYAIFQGDPMRARTFTLEHAVRNLGNAEVHTGIEVREYETGWHFHRGWQFVQILSGERQYEWRDGRVDLGPGQVLMVPPQWVHRGGSSQSLISFVMVYLSTDSNSFLPGMLGCNPQIVSGIDLTTLRDGCKSLVALRSQLPISEGTHVSSVASSRATAEKIRNRIHSLERLPSLPEIGSMVGRSPYYVSHLLRQQFGMSPRGFHLQLRLNDARSMLLRGGDSSQRCYGVWFCRSKSFWASFSPSIWPHAWFFLQRG